MRLGSIVSHLRGYQMSPLPLHPFLIPIFPVLSLYQDKIIYFKVGSDECGLILRDIDLTTATVGEPVEVKKCNNPNGRIKATWKNDSELYLLHSMEMPLHLANSNKGALPEALFFIKLAEKQ